MGCCPARESAELPSSEQARSTGVTREPAGANALSRVPLQLPITPPVESAERLFEFLYIVPPDRLVEEFKAKECLGLAHYLRHAVRTEDDRADSLMDYALAPEHAHYVYAMCRMLFESANGVDVRRPMLGQPVFVDQGEWPLDPIAMEDGVPFVVVTGWNLAGAAEMPHQYALHCLLNHEWTEAEIPEKTDDEIRAAAESLIRRRRLTGEAAEFIRRQVPASDTIE